MYFIKKQFFSCYSWESLSVYKLSLSVFLHKPFLPTRHCGKIERVVEGIFKAAVFPPQVSVYTHSVWRSTTNVSALQSWTCLKSRLISHDVTELKDPALPASGTRMFPVTLTLQWSSTAHITSLHLHYVYMTTIKAAELL